MRRTKEKEIEYQATHDPLTGLLNRSAFQKQIDSQIMEGGMPSMYAILEVNDPKGFDDAGGKRNRDKILACIAVSMVEALPASALICRYTGERFAMWLPNVNGENEAAAVAERVLDSIANGLSGELHVSVSMGISMYPMHGGIREHGFSECADFAVLQLVDSPENKYCIYNPGMINDQQAKRWEADGSFANSVRKWLNGNRGIAALAGGLLLALVVGMAVMMAFYVHRLEKLSTERADEYLMELSAQMGKNLSRELNNAGAVMDSLARKVQDGQAAGFESIMQTLALEEENYGFYRIALFEADGRWLSGTGEDYNGAFAPYLSQMEKEDGLVLSDMMSDGERNYLLYLTPLQDVTLQGKHYTGLGAFMDAKTLSGLMALNLYGGRGQGHLVNTGGDMIVCSPGSFCGNNIISFFESCDLADGVSAEDIRADFAAGRSRIIRYQDGTQSMQAYYTPAGYKDWYLVPVVPESVLNYNSEGFVRLTVLFCMGNLLIFWALIALVLFNYFHSRWRLLRLLHTDTLTGGSSKLKFEQDVKQLLRRAGGCSSMIYMNVERFKLINEQCGRETGDKLLTFIHTSIAADMGPGEYVCRIMADHFGVLIFSGNVTDIKRRVSYWNHKIQQYALQNNFPVQVVLSYGMYQIGPEETDVTYMLDKANVARQSIRDSYASGSLLFGVYDEALARKETLLQEMESHQEQALRAGEFRMYLQPKYNPVTEQVAGAEALVRWVTSDGEMRYPDQYIPLFESNGFIVKLDQYIFGQACAFLQGLEQKGMVQIPISVNLSRVNLNNPEFLMDYLTIWSQYGIDARLIEFEITENLIYEDMERLNEIIASIRSYGFRVSMDDFGSGYSSLNMLKDVELDVVKLDKNFFRMKQESAQKGTIIVSHLIELAESLGIEVVAEGVEKREQVDFLREAGCNLIQGYYYARPMPEDKMLTLLAGGAAS